MGFILSLIGRTFAILPERMLECLCRFLGRSIFIIMPNRSRVALSNLSHCFPNMSEQERLEIAYESASRMIEMALFVVASPYLSNSNLKKRIHLSENVKKELEIFTKGDKSAVLMIPHFAMMETITMFPLVCDAKVPHTGVFYRPFDISALENWIKRSRQRFGIELLSRKAGLSSALKFLKEEKGCIAVLFDQEAGGGGVTSLFFGRICSSSSLAGILAEGTNSDVGIFYARRTGFWKSEIFCERVNSRDSVELTIIANEWLEKKLREDENARYDWLWLHKRWKVDNNPNFQFMVRQRRSILAEGLAHINKTSVSRLLRVYISLPDSVDAISEILPMVKIFRQSRYDANISIVISEKYKYLTSGLDFIDKVIVAPESSSERLKLFSKLSKDYVDYFLNLRDGESADKEARAIKSEYSYSISQKGEKRSTRYVYLSTSDDLKSSERVKYEKFFRYFGMLGDIDYSLIGKKVNISPKKIENNF